MSKQTAGLVIPCVIIGMVGAVLSAPADQVLAGGNISAAARAKIAQGMSNSTFKTQNLPPAPDYGSSVAWAALPDKKDNADLVPLNTKYPESQATAAADVFFIHPTTAATARDNWNIPVDDPAAMRDVDDIL